MAFDGGEVMEIKVRDLDEDVVYRIDALARKKGVSRNRYISEWLTRLSLDESIMANEEKYQTFISHIIGISTKVITENTELLRKIYSILSDEG